MPSRFAFLIILVSCALAVSTACMPDPNLNANSNAASIDKEKVEVERSANERTQELALLIKLPYEPLEVTWRTQLTAEGRNSVHAALLFSPEDAKQLTVELPDNQPQSADIIAENWYPTELITKSEMHEESKITGKVYPANAFFQGSYNSGRLIKIDETDYFVLQLTVQ